MAFRSHYYIDQISAVSIYFSCILYIRKKWFMNLFIFSFAWHAVVPVIHCHTHTQHARLGETKTREKKIIDYFFVLILMLPLIAHMQLILKTYCIFCNIALHSTAFFHTFLFLWELYCFFFIKLRALIKMFAICIKFGTN